MHKLPQQADWDRFCELLARAAPWLELRGASPDPGLTGEQFAVGLLVSAIERLLVTTAQPEAFILIAQRLLTA